MARSKSSRNWLDEHFKDEFVQRSKQQGYRSRASYKLIELQKKDKLIKPGMKVVDLGAAPGGWSQLLVEWVGDKGQVFALDILPMDAVPQVTFIQGDFTQTEVLNTLLEALGEEKADFVFSDMAPNMSGIKTSDQAKSIYLAELALDLALQSLKPSGGFVAKVFQGAGFDEFIQTVKTYFKIIKIRKPEASRSRSTEVYLVALNLKN